MTSLRPTVTVDVAFCCDEAYIQHLTVAVRSLLDSATDCRRLRLWLLGKRLSSEGTAPIEKIVTAAGASLRVVELGGAVSRLGQLQLTGYWSEANFYRLLLPDLIPREVSRLVYLDSDLVLLRPVEQLWATDLQGCSLGAVLKPNSHGLERLGLSSKMDYFNSGVLVFDLDRWRTQDTHEEALAFVRTCTGPLEFADQDALNYVMGGRWHRLDPRWNQQVRYFTQWSSEIGLSAAEVRRVRTDPFIVHYTTGCKPWHYVNVHPFRKLYFRALDRTPYRGWRPRPSGVGEVARRAALRWLPLSWHPQVLRNRYRPHFHRLKTRLWPEALRRRRTPALASEPAVERRH